MTKVAWTVYDVINNKSIGTWDDICYAEEFLCDNEGEHDVWAVIPDCELVENTISYWYETD